MTSDNFKLDVIDRLARIEEMLAGRQCVDHEKRIRGLEKFQWQRDGIRWALVFVIPVAVSAAVKLWG